MGSHYNATRLGSPHIQKIFHRMLRATLDGLLHSTGHPLAREIRLQVVLFALKVLKHSTALGATTQWRFKDKILSAALSWFSFFPAWSFGGNRVQVKAETYLLNEVGHALRDVSHIGAKPVASLKSLSMKEELLQVLLQSEQTRLNVWLYPLNDFKGHAPAILGSKPPTDVSDALYQPESTTNCL
jgi:phosphatidylinositol 4-kinase